MTGNCRKVPRTSKPEELGEGAEVPESVEEVNVTEVHVHVPRDLRPEEVHERSSVITAMGCTSE